MLHYQPKIELSTGRVTSVEALVRWQHPERGLLPPAAFLPVAERSELIEPLTRWVLRRALHDYTEWTAAGHDWTVAVNVSARNLSSLQFVDSVRDILRQAEVLPDRLHLEITETALAFDSDVAGQVVDALAAEGISMSVDDFGIGFTGLSQLRTLDVTEIKIDRTFVAGPDGQRARPGHRAVGHRAGPPAGLRGDRRGRRDPGRGRLAASPRRATTRRATCGCGPRPGRRSTTAPGRRSAATYPWWARRRGHRYDADRHLATARRGTRRW